MAQRELMQSGVQALIDRLREQGVEAGREEAARIVAAAHAQAAHIIAEAQGRAEKLRAEARAEVAAEQAAAGEALALAARDAVLEIKNELGTRFAAQVRRMVATELRDPGLLQRLIIEIAGRTRPEHADAGRIQILLPREAVSLEELRARPEGVREGGLSHFVLSATRDLLREGVEVAPGGEHGAGIRVRLVEQDVEIDLTDKAVAALLMRHLLPRFRALLDGIVR